MKLPCKVVILTALSLSLLTLACRSYRTHQVPKPGEGIDGVIVLTADGLQLHHHKMRTSQSGRLKLTDLGVR